MITADRFQELMRLRVRGRVPFGYRQTVDRHGTVGPFHERGLTEEEHREALTLWAQLPSGYTYQDALFGLAHPEQLRAALDRWRAVESGRLVAAS